MRNLVHNENYYYSPAVGNLIANGSKTIENRKCVSAQWALDMRNWLFELLKNVFPAPVMYAAAILWLFHYLDKRASGPAKLVISKWLQPLPYDSPELASSFVELFARVYGTNLFTLRTLLRSAAITAFVTITFILEVFGFEGRFLSLSPWSLIALLANVASDYCSLFLVRWWLQRASITPIFHLFAAPIIGGAFVIFCLNLFYATAMFIVSFLIPLPVAEIPLMVFHMWADPDFPKAPAYFIPALVVHLWLFILGISVLVVRSLGYMLWASGKMQWFLRGGLHHPLQAVGYVAAVITFLITLLISLW